MTTFEVPLEVQMRWCPNGNLKKFKIDKRYNKIFGVGYDRRIASHRLSAVETPVFKSDKFPDLHCLPRGNLHEDPYLQVHKKIKTIQRNEQLKKSLNEKLVRCWAESIVARQKDSEDKKLNEIYAVEDRKHEEDGKRVCEMARQSAVAEEEVNLHRRLEEEQARQEKSLQEEKEKVEDTFRFSPVEGGQELNIGALEARIRELDAMLRTKITGNARPETADWVARLDEIDRQYEEGLKELEESLPRWRVDIMEEMSVKYGQERGQVVQQAVEAELQQNRDMKARLKQASRAQIENLKARMSYLCATKSRVSSELDKIARANLDLKQQLDECHIDLMQFLMISLKVDKR